MKAPQILLDEGTKALRLEMYLNRTKILADQDMLDDKDKEGLSSLAAAGVIGILKDTGGVDGDGKIIEILQGDPKVSSY